MQLVQDFKFFKHAQLISNKANSSFPYLDATCIIIKFPNYCLHCKEPQETCTNHQLVIEDKPYYLIGAKNWRKELLDTCKQESLAWSRVKKRNLLALFKKLIGWKSNLRCQDHLDTSWSSDDLWVKNYKHLFNVKIT